MRMTSTNENNITIPSVTRKSLSKLFYGRLGSNINLIEPDRIHFDLNTSSLERNQ